MRRRVLPHPCGRNDILGPRVSSACSLAQPTSPSVDRTFSPAKSLSPLAYILGMMVLLCCLPSLTQAQSISPQVTSNAGGTVQKDGIRVNWTLGQTAVGRWYTTDGRSGSITEGFQQPNIQVTLLSGASDELVSIAPNPVQSVLNLLIRADEQEVLTATLMDPQGRILQRLPELRRGTAQLNMQELPAGMYFLTIHQSGEAPVQSFKVIKIQ